MSSDLKALDTDISNLGVFSGSGQWTIRNKTLVAVIPTTEEKRRLSGKREVVFDYDELREYVTSGKNGFISSDDDSFSIAVEAKDIQFALYTLSRCPKAE